MVSQFKSWLCIQYISKNYTWFSLLNRRFSYFYQFCLYQIEILNPPPLIPLDVYNWLVFSDHKYHIFLYLKCCKYNYFRYLQSDIEIRQNIENNKKYSRIPNHQNSTVKNKFVVKFCHENLTFMHQSTRKIPTWLTSHSGRIFSWIR